MNISDWRAIILEEANSWIGTPYRPRAAVRSKGVDCVRYIYTVLQPFGFFENLELPDYRISDGYNSPDFRYLENLRNFFPVVTEPEISDILLFKYGDSWNHAGFYSGKNQYVHAEIRRGVVESEVDRKAIVFSIFGGRDERL